METNSQENTEPIDWADSGYDGRESQQSQTQSQPEFWGRLYPLKESLEVVDLITNTVTIGKVDTDIVLTRDGHRRGSEAQVKACLPREVFSKCSKVHFEIQRKQVTVMGAQTTQVIIIDRSTNGTYINGHVLRKRSGKTRCKVLRSNDIIGFPAGRPQSYEAYVFIDSLVSSTSPVPYSVRSKYQMSLRLGAGAFGEVFLVFDRMKGKPYALKTIVKDIFANSRMLDAYKQKLTNELNILQRVRHPNVIRLMEALDCKKEHYLILEFAEGKDLSHRIRENTRLTEDLAKLYFFQIANGVEYLHSQGIIHRDLKPANILLSSASQETLLKITDFGLSKVLSPATIMKTLCGTKLYVAPEVILGGGSFEYTEQVDIWSMGVILYMCLSGTEPFASEPEKIEELIKEAVFTMPSSEWDSVSSGAKSLINRMLVKDPLERIHVKEIIDDFWMQDSKMRQKVHELCNKHLSETDFSQSEMSVAETTFSSSQDEFGSQNETLTPSVSPPRKKLRAN